MYLRFLSALGLVVFVLLSSNSAYGQSALPQCSDGIDNDGDGKIDFVCPAGGTPYRAEQSK